MDNIISTALLQGGLGNQMFQIAHSYSQGLKNKIPSVFLPQAYTPMGKAKQPTHYINNIFKKINFVNNINVKKIVSEYSWNEPNLNFNWDESVGFNGYFQSSKNFLGYDKEIIDLFLPSEEFKEKIFKKYPQLLSNNTTSIHIRRGDYLTISDILPVIDISYIKHCMSLLPETETFFIFSDDFTWVKNNIKSDKVIFVEDNDDYEDLWMISLCKNNIMSNSSFSWWGSFLNQNKDNKVFVPNIWFGPRGEKEFNNVYENEWKKINVKFNNGLLYYND
jgi:hypothetical protein